VPFGAYVVDFYCATAKIIVELDGGQHAAQVDRDQQRTSWLASQGYAVLRYWNHDVLANTEGVLTDLLQHLRLRAPLTLSLSREGRGDAAANNLHAQVTTKQNQKDQRPSTGGLPADPAISSIAAMDVSNSVPSPLAGEGQGEGVLDGTKNANGTQKS